MKLCNVTRESGIPLMGHLAFGIIARANSNVIQVRATTICNMNCPFCSTDGGPFSSSHKTNYVVEPKYLVDWIKEIIKIKGEIHVNIDSVGEPVTYPHLIELISSLKKIKEVTFISMQSNGTLLTEKKIKELEVAGLNRIHLSVHSLDQIKSKMLFGNQKYEIAQIKDAIIHLNKSKIELLIAPVFLPSVNDEDMKELIVFCKEINCRIAIQKYEEYKYSRKMKEVKKMNYFKFYKLLKEWEKEFDTQLVYKAQDLDTSRAQNLPLVFKEGERVHAKIVAPGWIEEQMIAAAKNRCITIKDCHKNIGDAVNIKITEAKNNIYLAEMA
tara:strand:- start:29158 stop:30138 length:981 start_codon:yes stop_codon:yes gene_type:complete